MHSSNVVFIKDLKLKMHIGIHAHEIGWAQVVLVSAEVFLDEEKRWENDKIAETVSYDDLVSAIKTVSQQKHFKLIETFLETLAENFLRNDKICAVRLLAEKPGIIKNARGAGVEILRVR